MMCVLSSRATVQDGMCHMELHFPDAVAPHVLDPGNPDETLYSICLTSITFNEVE